MTGPRILAVGGAHIDRRGTFHVEFVPGASNPGAMREDVGGGAFNALRAAIRRGAAGALVSVRGGDAAGNTVSRAVAAAGVADLSAIFLDRATPSYTALIGRDGDVVAALADMSLYEIALPRQMRRSKLREAVAAADAVLTDANLPEAALSALARTCAGLPLFAIGVSPAKVVRLAGVLPSLACLFLNRREAAVLAGTPPGAPPEALVAGLRAAGLSRAMVTHGSDAVVAFDDGTVLSCPPGLSQQVVDVTGAGDALAGAAMVALLGGRPLGEALRDGMAAARLAVESASAAPAFTLREFQAALALVPQPAPMR